MISLGRLFASARERGRAATLARLQALSNRLLAATVGVFLFVYALQLVKGGAKVLLPLVSHLSANGTLNYLGLGWLGTYVVLSGSPIAGLSLALFGSGLTSVMDTFGMLNGSRLGASFLILLLGVLNDARGRGGPKLATIGVLAFLTTLTIYIPAMILGAAILQSGFIGGLTLEAPSIVSVIDLVYGPLIPGAASTLGLAAIFVAGVALLLISLRVFDHALPAIHSLPQPGQAAYRQLVRPRSMFLLGLGVTAVTLSVAVSVSLLMPMFLKGYIKRGQTIAYILGANISTFADTLAASFVVGMPAAPTIVIVEVICVTLVTVAVIFGCYRPYVKMMTWSSEFITSRWSRLAGFVAILLLMPLMLLFS